MWGTVLTQSIRHRAARFKQYFALKMRKKRKILKREKKPKQKLIILEKVNK